MRYAIWLLTSAAAFTMATSAAAQEGALVPADVAPDKAETVDSQPDEADKGSAENAAAAQDDGVPDIVITAQKREQRLQDVPVAVTALTAETLINRGISQVADIQRAVPSLTVTQTGNASNSSINLRGIGTFAFSIGVEPSVAVIVDDVALLQQSQAFSGLTDIARIEVLRGPQGTLFGKSASAGVINIVSQAPTRDLSASLGAQLTTDDEVRLDGAVSGRVSDWLGVRVNAFHSDREGYVRNLTTGHRLGAARSDGLRVRVDLDPTEALNVALIAAYSSGTANPVRTFREVGATGSLFSPPTGPFVLPSLTGVTPGPENYRVRMNIEGAEETEQSLFIGRGSLDLGFADLISISSYQDYTIGGARREDTDLVDIPGIGGRAEGVSSSSFINATQFSQELRLVSSASGPFSYLFGLYFSDGETDRTNTRFLSLPPAQRANWIAQTGTKSYAAFAQATYDLTPSTHIDAGIRFNREKIRVELTDIDRPDAGSAPAAACRTICRGNGADDVVTYKGALRQDINDDVMAYVSYATGYKGQGYDISTGFNPAKAATPVQPETSKAYEIGFKSMLLDRKLQLNLTGFWTDYKNFQAQQLNFIAGVAIFNLANVGGLRTKGVEAELSARPTRSLQLDATLGYLDAKITDYPNAQCYPGQTAALGCVDIDPGAAVVLAQPNLAGARLANAPRWKYSLSLKQDVALPGMPFDGFVQADWAYQSRARFDLLGNPKTDQEGYGIFNGSIGVEESENAAYRISLFVNNLFDKAYTTSITLAPANPQNNIYTQFLPRDSQRYFGVRARFRY
jgi:iron complex outermembrane receptor protein